mgnify:CR=1 FL=1
MAIVQVDQGFESVPFGHVGGTDTVPGCQAGQGVAFSGFDLDLFDFCDGNLKGIILSGSPASVPAEGSPRAPQIAILEWGEADAPLLALCGKGCLQGVKVVGEVVGDIAEVTRHAQEYGRESAPGGRAI